MRQFRAFGVDQHGDVAIAVGVVEGMTVGIAAGQESANASGTLAGAAEVQAARVGHQRMVVPIPLLEHRHAVIYIPSFAGIGPTARAPAVFLADAPPAKAIVGILDFHRVGHGHANKILISYL